MLSLLAAAIGTYASSLGVMPIVVELRTRQLPSITPSVPCAAVAVPFESPVRATLDLGTGSSRFDPNVDAHHHLVCVECGKVHDVYVDFTDVQIPPGADRGFLITSTEIVFRGRCALCAAAADDERGHRSNQANQPKETATHA
jgi:hypothetical protein